MTDGWLSLKIQLNLLSFLWKGPPIFRGFHCLWLLLDSFFLPLTFLPHKILSPNLHLFYKNLQKLASKSCKFVKKIPLLLLCCSRLRRDLFQFVLLECHSILVVYIASSEELLHTLLKCVSKSKGKLQRKGERERGKSHFLLALLIPICDSWNFQFFAWWSPSSWAFYQRESTLLSMLQWPHQF